MAYKRYRITVGLEFIASNSSLQKIYIYRLCILIRKKQL